MQGGEARNGTGPSGQQPHRPFRHAVRREAWAFAALGAARHPQRKMRAFGKAGATSRIRQEPILPAAG
ncbi:hypothetical protein Acid7E03_05980 [Acidisoma sp. 7E03]